MSKITLKNAKQILAPLNITIRKTSSGEYLIRIKNSPPGHGYFTTALDDAIATGKMMFFNKHGL